jgi:hypothetical protein
MHMVGRTYGTTTIFVDGIKVEVRQILFKGSERVPPRVGEVVRQAKRWLAIAVTKSNASGLVRDINAGRFLGKFDPAIFRHFFLQEPTPVALSAVWRNLAVVQSGLNMPFAVKVRTMGSRGYVNTYFPMYVSRAPISRRKIGACSISAGWLDDKSMLGNRLHSKGEMHIDLDWLFDANAPRTLIHEGGHKFANLWDVSYYDPDTRTYDDPIDAAGALRNADSYAHFAKTIALKADQRASDRAAAADDDAIGLSSLFG